MMMMHELWPIMEMWTYERLDDVDNDAWKMSYYVDENFMNDIDDDVNDETYCEKEKLLNVQIPLEWGVGKW